MLFYCILTTINFMEKAMISETDFIGKLGLYIRRLRSKKKYSIEKLSEYSETDYSSLNKIENGKQNPTAYTLYKIFLALDIDITQKFEKQNVKQDDLLQKIAIKLKVLPQENLKALYQLLDEFEITKRN